MSSQTPDRERFGLPAPGGPATRAAALGHLSTLRALWDAKCAGRAMPDRGDLDLGELRPWLGNLILVDRPADCAPDFRYRVYGTELCIPFGVERTWRTTAELHDKARATVIGEYGRVWDGGAPLQVEHRRSLVRGFATAVKLILPVSKGAAGRTGEILAAVYLVEISATRGIDGRAA